MGRCLKLLKTWIIFCFQKQLSVMLISYPNITCSVMHFLLSATTIINASIISSIFMFKTFAKICSNSYLNMDHEKLRRITHISILMISLLELIIFGLCFGTICTEQEALYTQDLLIPDNLENDFIFLPRIRNINIYAIVIIQVVHYFAEKKRPNMHIKIRLGTRRTPLIFQNKVSVSIPINPDRSILTYIEEDYLSVIEDVQLAVDEDKTDVKDKHQHGKEDSLVLKVDDLFVKDDFQVIYEDLIEVKDNQQIVEDYQSVVEYDPFVNDYPKAIKDDPTIENSEQLIGKEDPLNEKVCRLDVKFQPQVGKVHPLKVKVHPLVVKADPTVVDEDPSVLKDNQLVVKDYPSVMEENQFVVNEDQPVVKYEVPKFKNDYRPDVKDSPQLIVMIEDELVVEEYPSAVQEGPVDTKDQHLIVKDDPPVVNVIIVLALTLLCLSLSVLFYKIGFHNKWIIQWFTEFITFLMLISWFYTSNKITNYIERKFSNYLNQN